ncbi:MAG: copper-translocating P-type ATPase [Bacteroidetes bacterium]|nr:MAG: copper-translocating P-type ATPase [Bacteroidota bacterium]
MEHNHDTHNQPAHQAHSQSSGHNPSHGHQGHDHHLMMINDFKKRFWVSLLITVPVLVLSEMIQLFFGFHFSFLGDKYVLFAGSSVVFFYGGWPFLKGLRDEVAEKNPGMMTLIGMAITVAYLYSAAIVFGLKGMDFFWELATLIDIMLLGHWIEMKSILGASRSLELLVSLMPSVVHKVHDEHIMDIKLEELTIGDVVLIKPGEKVPADGIITDGESYLNESMLTGESKPVKKTKEQKVIGGSVNGNGSLKVKILHTGQDSYLNKVIAMVREAQNAKSKMQNLSNRAARWLTYIALAAGFITLFVWLAAGKEFAFALERMVTVMVISCPHALGLAVPLVVAISTAISAQKGLLIRNRTAFEYSRKITTIVFDKTGTLTEGRFGVTRYESLTDKFNREVILGIASALERESEHPIAAGIVDKAKQLDLKIPDISNFTAITGKGVKAEVEGNEVQVVSPGYLKENNISIPDGAYPNAAETVVFVIINKVLAGFIALADEIRPESFEAIKKFKDNGIKTIMATGDNKTVAAAVSRQLNLDGYYAEVLPHQKVEILKELQSKGEYVAMTGDGVNDAPALAQADVGIAVGSGTDVAAETADIILVNSNPNDILNLILFGKATYKKMVQNLLWATAYNAVSIPLAAGVLYSYGIMLSPAIGAVLMSLSTVIVAINAQLLKRQVK